MDDLAPLTHETLSETTYAALTEALTQGRFQPGQRLKIRDLAAQLGTSVTPVRDAILRLVQDEALSFRSARDIRIPGLTLAEYLEIRTLRLALEGLAAAEAAKHAGPADIAGLESLLARHETAMQSVDWRAGLQANQEFHFRLARLKQVHRVFKAGGIFRRRDTGGSNRKNCHPGQGVAQIGNFFPARGSRPGLLGKVFRLHGYAAIGFHKTLDPVGGIDQIHLN